MKMETPKSVQAAASAEMNPRTRMLLQAPILPLLLKMAWPNVLVMLAQASTGLIETFWVARLGTDALTGMAVVFPGFMMMQMLSAGAFGGGISSAIARALGGQRKADAQALVMHAVAIYVVLGLTGSAIFLLFGREIYSALGAEGASLEAALTYSNIIFGGSVFVWLMNGFASIIRGTGNMLVPSTAICVGVALLIPLSPMLIFGFGPIPAFGIAGAGYAVVIGSIVTSTVLGLYIGAGRAIVGFSKAKLRWPLAWDILRVGGVAAFVSLQTSFTVILTTSLVGAAGGPGAVAGYGTGVRLEYLMVPLAFGFGGPLVALVGTNVGAGQQQRALRGALIGGGCVFILAEMIGLTAAIWPHAWLGLFGNDPEMLASGSAYLRIVGPFYGLFGMGLALYFASQGAGRLFWPLVAGVGRLAISVLGGWLLLQLTGSVNWLFAALAAGLAFYGLTIVIAIASGAWFTPRRGDT